MESARLYHEGMGRMLIVMGLILVAVGVLFTLGEKLPVDLPPLLTLVTLDLYRKRPGGQARKSGTRLGPGRFG